MKFKENQKIKVLYKNWKGVEKIRTIIPQKIYFGTTDFHKEEGWLLELFDVEKNDKRTYSLKDIKEWFVK